MLFLCDINIGIPIQPGSESDKVSLSICTLGIAVAALKTENNENNHSKMFFQ